MSGSPIRMMIVVAAAENDVIGFDNDMPWRLSTDLKRFKALTLGKPVIMGRKTWESIGRPLPGRANIVITRDARFKGEGAEIAHSLEAGIELAKTRAVASGADAVCVIGGGEIYAQAMALATKSTSELPTELHITRVLADINGDTHFPVIDPAEWTLLRQEEIPAGEKDSHATRYLVYERCSRA